MSRERSNSFRGEPPSTEGRRRGAVLLVGTPPPIEPLVGAAPEIDFVHVPDGLAALQLVAEGPLGPALALVVVCERLPDMGGAGLLARITERFPDVARVLLADSADPERARALALDAVWPMAIDGRDLTRRIADGFEQLRLTRALHAEVAELGGRVDALALARRAQQRRTEVLVERLLVTVGGDAPLGAWLRSWLDLEALAQGAAEPHLEARPLSELLAAALPPGTLREAWLGVSVRPALEVLADSGQLARALRALEAGLDAVGRAVETIDWSWTPPAAGAIAVSLLLRDWRGAAPELLTDPFVVLPDGDALDGATGGGAPLAIVRAERLLERQAIGLALARDGAGLVARLRFTVAAPASVVS